jgi:L-seryl-tRNA(Ser) seleniumtransferase
MENSPAPPRGDPRASLPSVSVLLENPGILELSRVHSTALVTGVVRQTLADLRRDPGRPIPDVHGIIEAIRARISAEDHERIRPVVNATGIVLHTGLGRSVLPTAAARALSQTDRNVNLQIDLETGRRGKRNFIVEKLLCQLTGAESALVVNNNAAATFLILNTFCAGREVVISRGQLVEIGGSYRLPDCVRQAGARLVEVGTTNKTHLKDYETALGPATAAILRVNPSNYRIIGFQESVPLAELVTLKRGRDLLVIDDLGCGAIVDLSLFGLPREPTVQDSIAAGADLACFSGDKLIGGPQAGIIVGTRALLEVVRKAPLTRMLRAGKLTGIALEHTLRLFREPEKLAATHPVYDMLSRDPAVLMRRARALAAAVRRGGAPRLRLEVREGESEVGGGTLPGTTLPTALLALTHEKLSADALAAWLRMHEPPIIGRIEADRVCLDMRTLLAGDAPVIRGALCKVGGVEAAG